MSFDKNYPKRKDRRKPYYGAKSVDSTCRNNGSCPYCRRNRNISKQRTLEAAEFELKQLEKEVRSILNDTARKALEKR